MINTQTATAPPPQPVSRPAFFLTTNHYPLTTAFPHNGPMMFEPTIDEQTTTATGNRLLAAWLRVSRCLSSPASSANYVSPAVFFGYWLLATGYRLLATAYSQPSCSLAPCFLAPSFAAFLTTNHYSLTTASRPHPPYAADPPPYTSHPTPPMCSVKL
jgi:hypothetical protein